MSGVVGVVAQSGVQYESNTTVNISRSDSPDMALKLVRHHNTQHQHRARARDIITIFIILLYHGETHSKSHDGGGGDGGDGGVCEV